MLAGRDARGRAVVIALWKPWGHLSQWHARGEHPGLGELLTRPAAPPGDPGARAPGREGVGPDVRTVGRLDHDSEGLLLLTDDGGLLHRLTEPRFGHPRTYWAQVERVPGADALARLAAGPPLSDGPTRPCAVRRLEGAPDLPPRPVPIRVREHIPTAWVELTLTEGRNRQVRRMTAAVGHPTLRLVRVAVGPLRLLELGLAPGSWRPLSPDEEGALRAAAGVGSAGGRTGGARGRGRGRGRRG